jgi:hypothetical protein
MVVAVVIGLPLLLVEWLLVESYMDSHSLDLMLPHLFMYRIHHIALSAHTALCMMYMDAMLVIVVFVKGIQTSNVIF